MTQTYVNFPPCPHCRSRSVVFIKDRRKPLSRFEEQKYQLRCNDCGHLGITVAWVEQPLWEYSYVPKKKRRPTLLATFAQYFGRK